MKVVLIVLAFVLTLLFAGQVQAQAPTSYTLTIYAAGTPTVVGTPTVIPAASFICAQAAPVGVTVNPNKVVFDDVTVGLACIYTDPGTGPLSTLPFGPAAYEATVITTNSAGSSGESARALPFTHPGVVPPVRTGLRVIR